MTTYRVTCRDHLNGGTRTVYVNAPTRTRAAAKLRAANERTVSAVTVSPVQFPDESVTYVA